MRYVVRLLLIPSFLTLIAHLYLTPSLNYPGWMGNHQWRIWILVLVFAITFFTQRHRVDTDIRLEKLEAKLDKIEQNSGQRP